MVFWIRDFAADRLQRDGVPFVTSSPCSEMVKLKQSWIFDRCVLLGDLSFVTVEFLPCHLNPLSYMDTFKKITVCISFIRKTCGVK